MAKKTIGVMQPYIFPYLGYFQLLNEVDDFIFYDDVNYIKSGWINRNNILVSNKSKLITIPCIGASSNKKINQIKVDRRNRQFAKTVMTIKQSYSKAPFFEEVYPIIADVLLSEEENLALIAAESVVQVAKYLDLNKSYYFSSSEFPTISGMERSQRLITIVKELNGQRYLNVAGGKSLYSRQEFASHGIELGFVQACLTPYKQFGEDFVDGLSIIDVLMFCSKSQIHSMLKEGVTA